LPELIAFYEDHAMHRDKFEVLAIHDDAVKSFPELDKKLASIRTKNWQGKDLPFPILLDGKKETHQLYGIRGWPTALLIDPDGKLVGEVSVKALEEKLPPLPIEKRWARHRDMKKNVFWSFEPKDDTLQSFAETLQRWSGCGITLDLDAIKACGLTTNRPLPGVVIGGSITLRSLDELLLAPHGLGLVPSGEAQTLRITKRAPEKDALSYFQKLHARELNDRLDRGGTADEDKEAQPLEIKNQSLLEAVKLISKEYDLPFALDAKAMHTGRLDPEARVNGRINPRQLRPSLTKMIEPLGLMVEVRHEVVILIPGSK
jgi:hypothetical protein